MGEDATPRKSETVSSTPDSRNKLPSFSSFPSNGAKSQPRRSTKNTNSRDITQTSAPEERAPLKMVQLHRLQCCCPTEVSRPITVWQREEREKVKRKVQREREQVARVTQLGLHCNTLADREDFFLEIDLHPLA